MTDSKAAVVVGSSGGIGAALVAALRERHQYDVIHALSRGPCRDTSAGVSSGLIDVTSEDTIRAAAARIDGPLDLVIVATGMLHEEGYGPERALRDLDPVALARIMAVNTIGPALVLKHFSPLLARDRPTTFAVLSARVGSITDNRSGGWYGYRASKAALNMIVRSAAIELSRARPKSVCVGLHPGTVDTGLSKPFQAKLQPEKLFIPAVAAQHLLTVIDGLTTADTGKCMAWDGTVILP